MLSSLTASVLSDLSFKTRLGRRPHTINTDSLASLHSTQLARLTLLTTFFFPSFISFISCLPFWLFVAVTAKAILSGSVNHLEYLDYLLMMVFSL